MRTYGVKGFLLVVGNDVLGFSELNSEIGNLSFEISDLGVFSGGGRLLQSGESGVGFGSGGFGSGELGGQVGDGSFFSGKRG